MVGCLFQYVQTATHPPNLWSLYSKWASYEYLIGRSKPDWKVLAGALEAVAGQKRLCDLISTIACLTDMVGQQLKVYKEHTA